VRKTTFVDPLLRRSHADLRLVNVERGTVVAGRVSAAFDSQTRKRGLLGRAGMSNEEALIIAPCNGVHTLFMRFAIDIVFVAKDGRVVKACQGVRPWRIALAWRAFAVIEGAPGLIERSGTRPGDRVALQKAEALSP